MPPAPSSGAADGRGLPDPAEVAAPADQLFGEHVLDAGFGRQVARGGVATAAGQVVALGANLVAFPLLSRLLSPDDIGLVAISTVVTSIALAFAESGLSVASIQSPTLTRPQASNLFWCNVGLSLVAMLTCLALAGPTEWFYAKEGLATLISVTAVSIPISAVGIQHLALLRRSMQLNRVAYATMSSSVISNVVAVLAAWHFRSYWALVLRVLVQAMVLSLAAWLLCRWTPGLPRRGVGSNTLVRFGMKVFGSRLVYMLSVSADTALLGLIASTRVVGLYDRTFQLLVAPVRQVNGPLGGVVLPALARCRSNSTLYRSVFVSLSTLLIAMFAPVSGAIVGAPEWCVALVLGPGWEDAIPVFRLVGVGLVLAPLFNATGWLFTSQDRAGEMMKWQSYDALWRLFLIGCGAFFGLYGIVVATIVRLFTIPHGFYYALGQKGPVGLVDYLRLEAMAIAATIGATAAVLGFRSAMPNDLSPWVGMLASLLVAGAASTAVLLATPDSRGRLIQAVRVLARRKAPAPSAANAAV